MNLVSIGWLSDFVIYFGITKAQAWERYVNEYPEMAARWPELQDTMTEFQAVNGKFNAYEITKAD